MKRKKVYVDDFTRRRLKHIFPTLPSGRVHVGQRWSRTPYDERNSQSPLFFILGHGYSPEATHSGTGRDSGSSSNLKKDESKQPQNLGKKKQTIGNNGHGTGSKSDRTATQHPYSDNSSKSRIPTPIPKRSKTISPRPSPKPSASNHGRDVSRNSSPNGAPTRIRRGRGFTEKYQSARCYHTPSPEPAPGYGGKYFSERNCDKYTNYRPQRYDRSRPLSPLRYRSRRSRSRSISRSPGGYRHRGRDRTRSPSPRDKPLVASERYRSRRSRSRSISRSPGGYRRRGRVRTRSPSRRGSDRTRSHQKP